jgi:hypothetical protein
MRNGAPLFLTKNTTNFASGCGGPNDTAHQTGADFATPV